MFSLALPEQAVHYDQRRKDGNTKLAPSLGRPFNGGLKQNLASCTCSCSCGASQFQKSRSASIYTAMSKFMAPRRPSSRASMVRDEPDRRTHVDRSQLMGKDLKHNLENLEIDSSPVLASHPTARGSSPTSKSPGDGPKRTQSSASQRSTRSRDETPLAPGRCAMDIGPIDAAWLLEATHDTSMRTPTPTLAKQLSQASLNNKQDPVSNTDSFSIIIHTRDPSNSGSIHSVSSTDSLIYEFPRTPTPVPTSPPRNTPGSRPVRPAPYVAAGGSLATCLESESESEPEQEPISFFDDGSDDESDKSRSGWRRFKGSLKRSSSNLGSSYRSSSNLGSSYRSGSSSSLGSSYRSSADSIASAYHQRGYSSEKILVLAGARSSYGHAKSLLSEKVRYIGAGPFGPADMALRMTIFLDKYREVMLCGDTFYEEEMD